MSESQSLPDFQPRPYELMIFNLETRLLSWKRHFDLEIIKILFGNIIANLETFLSNIILIVKFLSWKNISKFIIVFLNLPSPIKSYFQMQNMARDILSWIGRLEKRFLLKSLKLESFILSWRVPIEVGKFSNCIMQY